MKYIRYVFIGVATFFIAEVLSINIGQALGAGEYGIGMVVCAISILSAIITACTTIIVDAINKR